MIAPMSDSLQGDRPTIDRSADLLCTGRGDVGEPGAVGLPVLLASLTRCIWISSDGEILELPPRQAAVRARSAAPLLCHARLTAQRLGTSPFPAFDLLELFAFVHPARPCVPTPRGLARALSMDMPGKIEDQALVLPELARRLLDDLARRPSGEDRNAAAIAWTMSAAGWPWGPEVLGALQHIGGRPLKGGINVWDRLPVWSDEPQGPVPPGIPITEKAVRERLAALLAADSEPRPQQADYAAALCQGFAPREVEGAPNLVLAEAGTGVGKTLGYIAPASLWAEANEAAVWISTYTRNLQSQIDQELDRLYPDAKRKAKRVVVRKGRENYLCLLNLEEAVRSLSARPGEAVAAALVARWAEKTREGTLIGGDFPGWLASLLGPARTLGLADRRGECIYSACPHYGRCFIERSIRQARKAQIVVANHALVMVQALTGEDLARLPTRFVFDEGHHVFEAADSAFAAHLSGQETHILRRWILGADRANRSARRVRGLQRRFDELVGDDQAARDLVTETLRRATVLPADGWLVRLQEKAAHGPCETFLGALRDQILARSDHPQSPYGLEVYSQPASPALADAAPRLAQALADLYQPLRGLKMHLLKRLDQEAADLDSETRRRIEALAMSLERRALLPLAAWQDMLADLLEETPPEFCDWLALERSDGRDRDVGLYRHWIDPTKPFAEALMARTHGLVITSATLTDRAQAATSGQDAAEPGATARDSDGDSADAEARAWSAAEARCGAHHLPQPAYRVQVPSPFDYAAQTRIFIVNDIGKSDLSQLAGAYRELFLAAGGGALGLFTAISRLRAVHRQIGQAIEQAGHPLFAQHVDDMDTGSLVAAFRDEEDSCLLGTDAVRDGVDVPGRSLRLIVFDRVPWPRPDIRHRARRGLFGGRHYDDQLARLRLKQAYGRLIRRSSDRGVFVLLDRMMPSRLADAFPSDCPVTRQGLKNTITEVAAFLKTQV